MSDRIDPRAHVGSFVLCPSRRCSKRECSTVLGRLQQGKRQIVMVFAGNAAYKRGVVELLPADELEIADGEPLRTHHVHIPLTARVRCYRCEEVIQLSELWLEHVESGGVADANR